MYVDMWYNSSNTPLLSHSNPHYYLTVQRPHIFHSDPAIIETMERKLRNAMDEYYITTEALLFFINPDDEYPEVNEDQSLPHWYQFIRDYKLLKHHGIIAHDPYRNNRKSTACLLKDRFMHSSAYPRDTINAIILAVQRRDPDNGHMLIDQLKKTLAIRNQIELSHYQQQLLRRHRRRQNNQRRRQNNQYRSSSVLSSNSDNDDNDNVVQGPPIQSSSEAFYNAPPNYDSNNDDEL